MRLVFQIEDSRFEGMGLSDDEVLDIVKTEITENTYPLGDMMTDCERVEAKPIPTSEIVVASEVEIEEAVNGDLMPLRKIHGAV